MGERSRLRTKRMSDYAIYLGEGVWWQLTADQKASGRFQDMPMKIRPWRARP